MSRRITKKQVVRATDISRMLAVSRRQRSFQVTSRDVALPRKTKKTVAKQSDVDLHPEDYSIATAQDVFELFRSALPVSAEIAANIMGELMVVDQKDSIGAVIEFWVEKFVLSHGIYIRKQAQTHEFPDYFLTPEDEEHQVMLEIKAFNYQASAAFDFANFKSYIDSLREDASKLDAYYLIFGYVWHGDGVFVVERVWLLTMEYIVGVDLSLEYPITCQVKKGVMHAIRPVAIKNLNSDNPVGEFKVGKGGKYVVGNLKRTILGLYVTLVNYEPANTGNWDWIRVVNDNYLEVSGVQLFTDDEIIAVMTKYAPKMKKTSRK